MIAFGFLARGIRQKYTTRLDALANTTFDNRSNADGE